MGRGFARCLSWMDISGSSAPIGQLYCPMDCRLVDPVLIRHPDDADALEDDLLGGLIGTPIVERVDAAETGDCVSQARDQGIGAIFQKGGIRATQLAV